MQSHTYADGPYFIPLLGEQEAMRADGRIHGALWSGKGYEERITGGLENIAVILPGCFAENGVVARKRSTHRLRMPLPQRGTALNIGEEECVLLTNGLHARSFAFRRIIPERRTYLLLASSYAP
jgi:hypothetical protein